MPTCRCARPLGLLFALSLGLPGLSPFAWAQTTAPVLETIYEGGLQDGWEDWGWAPRDTEAGHAARVNFANFSGWALVHHRGPLHNIDSINFQLGALPSFGDFLEIRVAAATDDSFARVPIEAKHQSVGKTGAMWIHVPMAELNPKKLPFDRIILRARKPVGDAWVEIDHYTVNVAPGSAGQSASDRLLDDPTDDQPRRRNTVVINCKGLSKTISPLIYGIAYDPKANAPSQWQVGASYRRWGGTPTTRYNWRLGNAWNTGADWYFTNINYAETANYTWRDFLAENQAHGVGAAITLPMLGWVARDHRAYAYPIASFGPQHASAPQNPDIGDGLSLSGAPLDAGDPRRTSIPAPPQFVGDWVRAIRQYDAAHHGHSVSMYVLDHQPALWNYYHRDVHPLPVTYDELVKRTLAYGSAVRQADPKAKIAGPAAWGWPEYFFSAKDALDGLDKKPDRLMHGDKELLAYYLQQLQDYEQRTGRRLLDVLDVHYYPQAPHVYGKDELDDPATQASRLRATRSLWDPTYTDESWINDRILLLPRLKALVAQHYPGTLISIGEYNFGGERSVSGALAQAEALGRFGAEGIYAAAYWTTPAANSSAYWAFRAYRNYDGKGGRFADHAIPSISDRQASVFASRDLNTGRVVLVALNLDSRVAGDTTFDLGSCGSIKHSRVFQYTGQPEGPGLGPVDEKRLRTAGPTLRTELPPYSMTVVEIDMKPSR
jgi:hypothetical protein